MNYGNDKTFICQGQQPEEWFTILPIEDRKVQGRFECGNGSYFYLVSLLANLDELGQFWRHWTIVDGHCVNKENFPEDELYKFGLVSFL